MLTGTNLVYTKQYNLRIVHEVVRRFGPLSRADIAQRTELTVQTISNLVKELLALGLVFETDRRRQKRGAPSSVIGINPEGAFTLGLDLDRDHLTGVLVDLAGSVRQRQHVDLDFPTPMQALDLMVETAEFLMAAEGRPSAAIRNSAVSTMRSSACMGVGKSRSMCLRCRALPARSTSTPVRWSRSRS